MLQKAGSAGDGRMDREALRQAEQSGVLNFRTQDTERPSAPGKSPESIWAPELRFVRYRPARAETKKTYTRFEMRFTNPLPVGLHISKEGFLDRIGKNHLRRAGH